jgi:NADH-quinone oxidoreductase subunit A
MTDSIHLMVGLFIFVGAAIAMGLGTMLFGRLIRPKNPGGLKDEIYECGEPTVGPAWVQFDLRFYVVAILFLVFDVEIAVLYPWAVTYKIFIINGLGEAVFWEMMFFFGLIILGFLYLWRFGYLDWVRHVSPVRSRREE